MTENSLLLRSKANEGLARVLVHFVHSKLHADAVKPFKGEAKHQEFGFGIDEGPLPGLREPRPANLKISMFPVDIPEASRTDDNALRFEDLDDEWNGGSVRPAFQRYADVAVDGSRGRNHGVREIPEVAIGGGLHQFVTIRRQHRPELNSWADQWFHIHVEVSHKDKISLERSRGKLDWRVWFRSVANRRAELIATRNDGHVVECGGAPPLLRNTRASFRPRLQRKRNYALPMTCFCNSVLLLFVVHRQAAELLAPCIGPAHVNGAGLAIGRHDNSTRAGNFPLFLNG